MAIWKKKKIRLPNTEKLSIRWFIIPINKTAIKWQSPWKFGTNSVKLIFQTTSNKNNYKRPPQSETRVVLAHRTTKNIYWNIYICKHKRLPQSKSMPLRCFPNDEWYCSRRQLTKPKITMPAPRESYLWWRDIKDLGWDTNTVCSFLPFESFLACEESYHLFCYYCRSSLFVWTVFTSIVGRMISEF